MGLINSFTLNQQCVLQLLLSSSFFLPRNTQQRAPKGIPWNPVLLLARLTFKVVLLLVPVATTPCSAVITSSAVAIKTTKA